MVKHSSETVEIMVNGEPAAVPAGITVSGLLKHLGIVPERVAVELNRSIIRQPAWDTTGIGPGAQIEIVQFVGGG
jgi:thiamine biosynthesis protein ThiS